MVTAWAPYGQPIARYVLSPKVLHHVRKGFALLAARLVRLGLVCLRCMGAWLVELWARLSARFSCISTASGTVAKCGVQCFARTPMTIRLLRTRRRRTRTEEGAIRSAPFARSFTFSSPGWRFRLHCLIQPFLYIHARQLGVPIAKGRW